MGPPTHLVSLGEVELVRVLFQGIFFGRAWLPLDHFVFFVATGLRDELSQSHFVQAEKKIKF